MDLAKQHVGSVDTSVRWHLRMFPKDGHGGVVVGQRFFQPNPTSRKLVPRHRPRECGGFTAWFAKTCSWWIRQRKSENFEQSGDANLKWLLFAVCWLLAQHFAREFYLLSDRFMWFKYISYYMMCWWLIVRWHTRVGHPLQSTVSQITLVWRIVAKLPSESEKSCYFDLQDQGIDVVDGPSTQ